MAPGAAQPKPAKRFLPDDESGFNLPAFGGSASVSSATQTTETGPRIIRKSGLITVDQSRLVFSVLAVAKHVDGDFIFRPADVFHYYNNRSSSGSSLRQLEFALASFCDLCISYKGLPAISDGSGHLVSHIDTGRLSLGPRSFRSGTTTVSRLQHQIDYGAPRRRKYWRIRFTDAGSTLLFRSHYIRVFNNELAELPRSPIARWLYLWLHSHGGRGGGFLPHRLSRIAYHAGFVEPGYESRYAMEGHNPPVRVFQRVLQRIERYIPSACARGNICGWATLPGPEPVLHVLKLPAELKPYWDRVSQRFSSRAALGLLLRYGSRKDQDPYPSHGSAPPLGPLKDWWEQAKQAARKISGDRDAQPTILRTPDHGFVTADT